MRASRVERVAGLELRRRGMWYIDSTDLALAAGASGKVLITPLPPAGAEVLGPVESVGWERGSELSLRDARQILEAALGHRPRLRLMLLAYHVEGTDLTVRRHASGVGGWVVEIDAEVRLLSIGWRTDWPTRLAACEAVRQHLGLGSSA